MAVLFLRDKVPSQASSQEPTSEKGSAPGPGLKVISKECLSPKDLKKRKTTSAESRELFGNDKMRFIGTSKVGTDPFSQLLSGQQAIVLNHVAFAMHAFGLNRIEPGALRGQQERQNANLFARLLDLLVVLANTVANGLTLVPGGIIPDQEPVVLALLEQALAAPVQELYRDRADGASSDEAQPHLVSLRLLWDYLVPQDPIAGQRLGIGIPFLPGLLHQAHGMALILPGVQARQGKATPPHLVEEASGPVRLATGPSNQAVASVFFSRYWGSGLVIQCLARFQLVLRRLRARRTLSLDTSVAMSPCSKLTWAASANVHTPRSLPKSRGLWCKRSLRRSAPSSEKVVRSRWGREEPSCSTASPQALKPWITLRTVWSWQPSWQAMAGARCPRADAVKIWQRRNTKASDERSAVWICRCSSWVSGRIKIGFLIPSILPHSLLPLVRLH